MSLGLSRVILEGMFGQFFKILAAIIVVKITGYALIVTLLQDKLPINPLLRFTAAVLLCGNFYFVWLTFKRNKKYAWPLLAGVLNLGLVAALLALGSLR